MFLILVVLLGTNKELTHKNFFGYTKIYRYVNRNNWALNLIVIKNKKDNIKDKNKSQIKLKILKIINKLLAYSLYSEIGASEFTKIYGPKQSSLLREWMKS